MYYSRLFFRTVINSIIKTDTSKQIHNKVIEKYQSVKNEGIKYGVYVCLELVILKVVARKVPMNERH